MAKRSPNTRKRLKKIDAIGAIRAMMQSRRQAQEGGVVVTSEFRAKWILDNNLTTDPDYDMLPSGKEAELQIAFL